MRPSTSTARRVLASALCGLAFTACAATPPVQGQSAGAAASVFDTLAWSDEFETVDTSNWTFETGGHGWGNNELQYYTNGANAFIQYDAMADSRVLVIEARRGGTPAGAYCSYGSCQFSSTRMITRDKREFRYGRIEARIRLPHTRGIWPAFWMLGANFDDVGWPTSGEIDIMEHIGSEATLTHGALHGPGYSGATHFSGTHDLREAADARYHVYAVEWHPDGIDWFVDGSPYFSVTRAQVEARGPWVFGQPFFLLLNVAVGGDWPGSPNAGSVFPQRMYVDWVRVYEVAPPPRRRNGAQPLAPPGAAATPPSAAGPMPVQAAGRPVPPRSAAAPVIASPPAARPVHRPLARLAAAAAVLAERCGAEHAGGESSTCSEDGTPHDTGGNGPDPR